jgi:hypothetical protein
VLSTPPDSVNVDRVNYDCAEAIPVVLGSKMLDGHTEINTWTYHPDPAYSNIMLIGATTDSRAVTDTGDSFEECRNGCAVVATWKNNDTWIQRYVYTNMRSVLEFANNEDTQVTIVLMSREKSPGVYAYGLGFIKWANEVMELDAVGYQTSYPYDHTRWNNFGNVMLF